MSDSIAGSLPPEASLARPTLGSLILGVSVACALSAYFLFDTLILRQPVTQTTATGKDYVLRLYQPEQAAPHLNAAGARLIASINKAKEEAVALRREIEERTERQREYQAEVDGLREQLITAERMLAELKVEIEELPDAFEGAYALRTPAAKTP